ncbi:unnamed protein product [Thelazia callipaeda]|uniref:MIF4G domain-containing protein n=1 Tax=Thelazia callipaeda TaxID=103827 RepID=A0A0N5D563_THECL|nr:unnamed protein product [Thelazia callipaeda]
MITGLRSTDEIITNTKPSPTAGAKQLKKDIVKKHCEENNNDNNDNSHNESSKCANAFNGCTRRNADVSVANDDKAALQRTESALSSESTTSSQASTKSPNSSSSGQIIQRGENISPPLFSNLNTSQNHQKITVPKQHLKRCSGGSTRNSSVVPRIDTSSGITVSTGGSSDKSGSERSTPIHKLSIVGKEQHSASKKKQLNGKEIEELASSLRKLNLTKENSLVEQFITSKYCLNAIFHGIVVALMHYFECRDRLRIDHFRVWITFLNFVSDLYANFGYIYEGELVDLVFRIFGYMLKAPVLDTLKIEELESLIGFLLSVGYDLERQCPEQLAILKDLIRDAFIEVQEPWARKMILLLMELGASGWKLPPEASEYYFQQTSS